MSRARIVIFMPPRRDVHLVLCLCVLGFDGCQIPRNLFVPSADIGAALPFTSAEVHYHLKVASNTCESLLFVLPAYAKNNLSCTHCDAIKHASLIHSDSLLLTSICLERTHYIPTFSAFQMAIAAFLALL